MTKNCSECGTPLDEIPFDECKTHRAHYAAQPVMAQDDLLANMEHELLELVYGRTGDD